MTSVPAEYTSNRMNDSSPHPRTPSEEIAGLVERVTFFNEESGFAVLRVKVRGQRDLVTVLGSVPSVSAGEWLTAEGWWVRDKEHGLQFKAQVLKATPPTTSEGVERYVGGGFVKGVGPVLAKKRNRFRALRTDLRRGLRRRRSA
jgi:exodeoxyribonuclease V alpha subunit